MNYIHPQGWQIILGKNDSKWDLAELSENDLRTLLWSQMKFKVCIYSLCIQCWNWKWISWGNHVDFVFPHH